LKHVSGSGYLPESYQAVFNQDSINISTVIMMYDIFSSVMDT